MEEEGERGKGKPRYEFSLRIFTHKFSEYIRQIPEHQILDLSVEFAEMFSTKSEKLFVGSAIDTQDTAQKICKPLVRWSPLALKDSGHIVPCNSITNDSVSSRTRTACYQCFCFSPAAIKSERFSIRVVRLTAPLKLLLVCSCPLCEAFLRSISTCFKYAVCGTWHHLENSADTQYLITVNHSLGHIYI